MMTRAQKRAQQQLRNDLQALTADAAGQRVLGWLLDLCGLYAGNPETSGVREGRRQIGLSIVEALYDVDPALYPRLLLALQNQRRNLSAVDLMDDPRDEYEADHD